jgi:hypothetical protein
METPPPPDGDPIRTDAEVLHRIGQLIDPAARMQQGLWLFFLDRHARQMPVVVPIDDVPDDPEPELVGNLCWIIAEVLGDAEPEGSVVIALTRAGVAQAEGADLRWHEHLLDAAAVHGVRLRMICLATPDGILSLG